MTWSLLATGAVLVAQSQPTFYAAWEDGREAEGRGQWRQARAAYLRALALRARPAARVLIYGNNLLTDYYPHARMARCSLELGEFEACETQLKASEAAGEPGAVRQDTASRLAARRARPEPRPHPVTAAPATAPPVSIPTGTPAPPAVATAPDRVPAPVVPPFQGTSPAPSAPQGTSSTKPVTTSAQLQPLPPPAALPLPSPANPTPAPAPTRIPAWTPWALGAAAVGAFLLLLRGRRPKGVPDEANPRQIGPYLVGAMLGRGGFATTYLGTHVRTGAKVALKILHPYRQDDPEFLGRFRQEARLGSLLDHPGIVRMVDLGPEGGPAWLAMEYVEGPRLDAWLRETGPLPLSSLVSTGLEIAEAMAHAHDRGIVHRDLKPANILRVDGRVKIMDFGIARQMDADTLTSTYAFLGTPLYAAPEAQLKTRIGPEADLYSLGVLLFEMASGKPPFQGETPFEILDRHRKEDLPDLAALRPDLPAELIQLILGLCAKTPEDRPDDTRTLAVLRGLAAQA